MVKIIIGPQRSRVEESDVGLLWALDKKLSFKVQGAHFTRAFKGYMDPVEGKYVAWDGREKLLEESDLSFQNGLLRRVIDFYRDNGVEPEVIDQRPPKSLGMAIDILPRLLDLGKVPRPYQLEAVKAIRDNDLGIIRLPTGSGKSILAALITADIGKRTIIYVIGKDLLYQFYYLFKSIFAETEIGIIGDGKCEIGDINIVSIWTAGQALGLDKSDILVENDNDEQELPPEKYNDIKCLLKEAKLQILDECHVSSCTTITEISKNINPEHLYGMSASPWRDDGKDLLIEAFLGHKIIDISASILIEQNYLVQPYIRFIKVPKFPTKLNKQYQTIYKNYIVENDIRNNLVLEATQKMIDKGYKPLVLFNSIKHGSILYEIMNKHFPCTLLSGKDKMKLRNQAKEDIESGEIKAIIASRIFDIGLDLPCLSGLVVASSGKSSVRALQRIGRVLRPYASKKFAAVADFVDDAPYLKSHSQARKKIYETEEGFIVKWPT
jgi:superfamily II DNA or RNA helicase